MRANRIRREEVWIRCPFCGDSQKDPNKAHFRIHLVTGLFFCHRCNEKGKVTPAFLARINLLDIDISSFDSMDPPTEIFPGALSPRRSLLPRFNTLKQDLFKIYWLGNPEPVGYYLRSKTEKQIQGFTGFAWPANPKPLISSAESPLRLVEGPYDVKHAQDVCCFGLFNSKLIIQQLRHHYFILSPDGDVWTDESRKRAFFSSLTSIIKARLNLVGVEFHEANQDPDDQEAQRLIPLDFLKRRIAENTRSRTYQYTL